MRLIWIALILVSVIAGWPDSGRAGGSRQRPRSLPSRGGSVSLEDYERALGGKPRPSRTQQRQPAQRVRPTYKRAAKKAPSKPARPAMRHKPAKPTKSRVAKSGRSARPHRGFAGPAVLPSPALSADEINQMVRASLRNTLKEGVPPELKQAIEAEVRTALKGKIPPKGHVVIPLGLMAVLLLVALGAVFGLTTSYLTIALGFRVLLALALAVIGTLLILHYIPLT